MHQLSESVNIILGLYKNNITWRRIHLHIARRADFPTLLLRGSTRSGFGFGTFVGVVELVHVNHPVFRDYIPLVPIWVKNTYKGFYTVHILMLNLLLNKIFLETKHAESIHFIKYIRAVVLFNFLHCNCKKKVIFIN